jgi:exodeoxyribonuclease V alpha subunit
MTVHKSQGSEFDEVVVVLPPAASPLCSRELIYSGVTRARRRVHLIGSRASVRAAVARRTRRTSGLARLLWGQTE